MSNVFPRRGRLMAAAAAALLAVATGAHADQVDRQSFVNKLLVDQPDVVGGYASSYVVVKVKEGVGPAQLRDGRLTFEGPGIAGEAPRPKRNRGGAAAGAPRPAIGLAGPVRQRDQGGAGGAGGVGGVADDRGRELTAVDLADALARANAGGIEPVYPLEFANADLARRLGLDRYYIVEVPAGTDTPAFAAQLSTYEEAFAETIVDGIGGLSQLIPDDVHFSQLWGMNNTGQFVGCAGVGTADADIDAPEAWDIFTGGDNITLAVIDSGVNPHNDIASKMVPGWNSNNNTNNTSDGCDHGTHVAGTAGAVGNNNIGVAGVSWGVRIMPIRVLNGCSGSETHCANGIIWAADNGANIGTMSLQYYTGISYFEDAVAYAHGQGMLLIAATGNNQGRRVAYPAKFDHCMGVGATTHDDAWATFSNYGPEIDLCAPGELVYSLLANGGYGCKSGTSMATPHVSGLASLIWSFNPNLTNDEVAQILIDTAEDLGAAGFDERHGWGRINAHSALVAAGNMSNQQAPHTWEINTGRHLGGDLNSLRYSDDDRLVVEQRAPVSVLAPSIDVELEATAPVAVVSELAFRLEASSSAIPAIVPQRIELYAYGEGPSTEGWEQVDQRLATMGDSVVEVIITDNPSRFIDPLSRTMKARLRWFDPRTLFFPAWVARIDQSVWELTY